VYNRGKNLYDFLSRWIKVQDLSSLMSSLDLQTTQAEEKGQEILKYLQNLCCLNSQDFLNSQKELTEMNIHH